MLTGYNVTAAHSHAMEPEDLWDRFLDKKYAAYAPKHRRIGKDYRYFSSLEVLGHKYGAEMGPTMDEIMFIKDGKGGHMSVAEAYADYIDRGYSAESYLDYMDAAGIDHLFIYPTFGLLSTGVPNMEPKLAAAIKRAYNDWLYEFCLKGNGRIHGVAALDLRDVDLAVAEARRCVNELGYKSVEILPDPPTEGIPLDHPYYDELWAAIAELGVPLGCHEG